MRRSWSSAEHADRTQRIGGFKRTAKASQRGPRTAVCKPWLVGAVCRKQGRSPSRKLAFLNQFPLLPFPRGRGNVRAHAETRQCFTEVLDERFRLKHVRVWTGSHGWCDRFDFVQLKFPRHIFDNLRFDDPYLVHK